jgi:hypothetical protein
MQQTEQMTKSKKLDSYESFIPDMTKRWNEGGVNWTEVWNIFSSFATIMFCHLLVKYKFKAILITANNTVACT